VTSMRTEATASLRNLDLPGNKQHAALRAMATPSVLTLALPPGCAARLGTAPPPAFCQQVGLTDKGLPANEAGQYRSCARECDTTAERTESGSPQPDLGRHPLEGRTALLTDEADPWDRMTGHRTFSFGAGLRRLQPRGADSYKAIVL
jgi:hypothetical protein